MKRIFFFLLLLSIVVMGCTGSKSENKTANVKDSLDILKQSNEENFAKVVNYVECLIVIELLEKSKGKDGIDESKRKEDIKFFTENCPCKTKREDFLLSDTDTVINTLNSSKIQNKYTNSITILKEINEVLINIPDNIKESKKLTTNLFIKGDTLLNNKISIKEGNITYNNNISINIQQDVTNLINSLYKDISGSPQKTSSPPDEGNVNNSNNDQNVDTFLPYFNLLLNGLIIIALMLLYRKVIAIPSVENSNPKNAVNESNRIQQLENTVNKLEDKINKLEDKINTLEKKVSISKIVTLEINRPEPETSNKQVEESEPQQLIAGSKIKFGGRPTDDGNFTDLVDSFVPGESLYQFNIVGNYAHFEIVNNVHGIANLIKFSDALLKPVCEELNSHTFTHTSIETNEKGEAIWDEERQVWEVTSKAQIKYI